MIHLPHWLTLPFLVVPCIAPPAGEDDPAQDRRAFQGTWVAVSLEEKGKPLAKDEVRTRGLRLIFTGQKVHLEDKGGRLRGTFLIDVDRKPKALDWTFELEGGEKSTTLAIYELKDDTLKICWNSAGAKTRPGDFKTNPKGVTTLATFKRQP